MKKIFYIYIFLFIFISCNNKTIILAKKDVTFFCDNPEANINGKNQINNNGFGTKKVINNKNYITYPALYIGSSSLYSYKESFILGGFDFSNIKKKIKKAYLKFYVNYCSNTRKNVIVFIRPVKKDWEENSITYNDIYQNNDIGAELKEIIEKDEKKCKLFIFDINQNEFKNFKEIPFPNSYKEISIDITEIVEYWLLYPDKNFGLLIDPMWTIDLRYCTTSIDKQISDFGIIEIASSEWFYWDGKIPDDFVIDNGVWLNIKNKAKNKIKYVPRIEIYY